MTENPDKMAVCIMVVLAALAILTAIAAQFVNL